MIELLVAEASISPDLAHAILLAAAEGSQLATPVAAMIRHAGFEERLILDLGEFVLGD